MSLLQYDTTKIRQQAADGLLACRPESSIAHHAMGVSHFYGTKELHEGLGWYRSAMRLSKNEKDEIIGAMTAWCVTPIQVIKGFGALLNCE